jgi:hypothetical protein
MANEYLLEYFLAGFFAVTIVWALFVLPIVLQLTAILRELRKLNRPAELKRLEEEQARRVEADIQRLERAREL